MFDIRLHKRRKVRVVVCLKIRVSAAFCASQENKINMFQDSRRLRFYFIILVMLDLNSKAIGRYGFGFRQCFATLTPLQHCSVHHNCYRALLDAANRFN